MTLPILKWLGRNKVVSILFIEVFSLWRALNPLILLVPYAIFRTPSRNWHFLGDIALVQKWPKRCFPLCDAGLRVSEHLPGPSRSYGCSENLFHLYWGVFSNRENVRIKKKAQVFQSSLPKCSYCDEVREFLQHIRRWLFQSSLLRCSDCDLWRDF